MSHTFHCRNSRQQCKSTWVFLQIYLVLDGKTVNRNFHTSFPQLTQSGVMGSNISSSSQHAGFATSMLWAAGRSCCALLLILFWDCSVGRTWGQIRYYLHAKIHCLKLRSGLSRHGSYTRSIPLAQDQYLVSVSTWYRKKWGVPSNLMNWNRAITLKQLIIHIHTHTHIHNK